MDQIPDSNQVRLMTRFTLQLTLLLVRLSAVLSIGSMNTLGPMWSKSANLDWDARAPFQNSFALCVLKSGTMIPTCTGTYPTPDPPNNPMLALSSGGNFTCGLEYQTGKPFCWGLESGVPLSYKNVSYTSLSAGQDHVCAMRSTGSIDCWGSNDYDQQDLPGRLKGVRFMGVSSGYGFTCGLVKETGAADCWGWHRQDDSPSSSSYKQQPVSAVFSALFSGGAHTCGLEKNTGVALCWGWNNFQQSDPPNEAFSSLSLGLFHSCGILQGNGTVMCWGDDGFNQRSDSPREEAFSDIAAGDYYTCGVSLKDPHKVKCWGNSVDFRWTNISASQGLCRSQECSSRQYELLDECPQAGDRVCLECFNQGLGNLTQCSKAPAPAPGRLDESLTPMKSNNSKKLVGVGVGVAVAIIVIASVVAGYLVFRRNNKKPRQGDHEEWQSYANRLVSFSRSDLIRATDNYSSSMILGKGSCGVVYKAVLPHGQELALKKSQAGDKTLVKELALLSRLHHTHLVNLVGYCAQELLLAFEYMENGSLFDCMFRNPEIRLDLFKRIRIAAQSARGLEYLHVYASPQILHRDVKSANILLDRKWNAHISDFGYSHASSLNDRTEIMTLVGTPGYMDPEALQTAKFTAKSDVYSFGVVLMELLTGRQAMVSSKKNLVMWASEQEKSTSRLLFDPRIYTEEDSVVLGDVLELAYQCVLQQVDQRPSMSYVASTLERVLLTLLPSESDETYLLASSSSDVFSGMSSKSLERNI